MPNSYLRRAGEAEYDWFGRTASVPEDFDSDAHQRLHPHVARAGMDPGDQYSLNGAQEGRPCKIEATLEESESVVGKPSERDARFHRNSATKWSSVASRTNKREWMRTNANEPGLRVLEIEIEMCN